MDKKKIAQYILFGLFIGFLVFLGLADPARAIEGDYYINQEEWDTNNARDYMAQSFTVVDGPWYVGGFNLRAGGEPYGTTYLCEGEPTNATIEEWSANCVTDHLTSATWSVIEPPSPYPPWHEADFGETVELADGEMYSMLIFSGHGPTLITYRNDDIYPGGTLWACNGNNFECFTYSGTYNDFTFRVVEGIAGISATLIEPEHDRTYLTAIPRVYIESNLTDVFPPLFTAKISDGDDNQLYSRSGSATSQIGGFWVYDSVTPALPDGNYKISGRVYSIESDEFSDWTTDHTFAIAAPTGGGGTSWGDELEEPVYVDEDFGLIGNWFRDVLLFLFMPSTDQMGNLNILIGKLKKTVPLRYFFDLKEAWDSASKVTGEPPSFSLDTNFGAVTIFDGNGVKNMFGASNWALVKDFSKNFIYLAGLVYLFFRFLRPMFKL